MRTPASSADITSKRVREAAVRVFAQKGFAAAGIREIATEANLTPAALYHYMTSKEDLLVEIMRSTIEPLDRAAREAIIELDEPERRLGALVALHVWMHGSRAKATLVTDTELRSLQGAHRASVLRLRDRYQKRWRDVIAAGVADGTFDVDDVPLTAIGLLELCTGVSHWYAKSGRRALIELCDIHVNWALRIVLARRDGRLVRRVDLDLPDPAARFPLREPDEN